MADPERRHIFDALRNLGQHRPLFHSESDFQHALAWEFQTLCPDARVRLEVPIYGLGGRGALDIVTTMGGVTTAFELKYFKARLDYSHGGDRFILPPTVARDIARHDVCKDICRVEHAIGSGQAAAGFVIALSNDPGFWRDTGFEGIDSAFKIHHGQIVRGTLAWSERAGLGTTKNRDKPLVLAGEYEMCWIPYSDLGVQNGEFRVLVIPVTTGVAQEAVSGPPPRRPPVKAGTRSCARDLVRARAYFAARQDAALTLTFADIEALIGPLPASAHNHAAWWHHVDSHSHAVWELEGYRASPNLTAEVVTFSKR